MFQTYSQGQLITGEKACHLKHINFFTEEEDSRVADAPRGHQRRWSLITQPSVTVVHSSDARAGCRPSESISCVLPNPLAYRNDGSLAFSALKRR